MNKDININKNKPAPEVAGALGDMLADSTSQITVIIPESANLKNYDLLMIHWASLSEESTDKSYPLPITKEKAGKSYSYVISEEKIKKNQQYLSQNLVFGSAGWLYSDSDFRYFNFDNSKFPCNR